MIQEASNTVRIHAAPGRSEELGAYLAAIVQNLPSLPGCLTSVLKRDEHDSDLWIVDVRWQSCQAMNDHFAEPDNEGLNGLLTNLLVRQVSFESDAERCNLPGAR